MDQSVRLQGGTWRLSDARFSWDGTIVLIGSELDIDESTVRTSIEALDSGSRLVVRASELTLGVLRVGTYSYLEAHDSVFRSDQRREGSFRLVMDEPQHGESAGGSLLTNVTIMTQSFQNRLRLLPGSTGIEFEGMDAGTGGRLDLEFAAGKHSLGGSRFKVPTVAAVLDTSPSNNGIAPPIMTVDALGAESSFLSLCVAGLGRADVAIAGPPPPQVSVAGWVQMNAGGPLNVAYNRSCPEPVLSPRILVAPGVLQCVGPGSFNGPPGGAGQALTGEGHWTRFHWTGSQSAMSKDVGMLLWAHVGSARVEYLGAPLAGINASELWLPTMDRVCLGDGVQPVSVDYYSLMFRLDPSDAACASYAPSATDVTLATIPILLPEPFPTGCEEIANLPPA